MGGLKDWWLKFSSLRGSREMRLVELKMCLDTHKNECVGCLNV